MKNRIKWVIIVVLTLAVGLGGLLKLFMVGFFVENAKALNYSPVFGQLIGFFEVIGCIGLYFRKWRLWASLGLCAILFGAIGVSVGAQAGIEHHIGPAIPLVLCILVTVLDDSYKLIRKDTS